MQELLILEGNPKGRHHRKHSKPKCATRKKRAWDSTNALYRYLHKKKAKSKKHHTILKRAFTMKHRRKYHYKKNPPMRNIVSNIGGQIKPALVGAAGIAVNKVLANQIAILAKVDVVKKNLIELATALILLPMLAKILKKPILADAAKVAAAVAIYDFVKPQLPAVVQGQLGGMDGYNFPRELETGKMLVNRAGELVDPGISYIPEFNF